MVVLICWAPVRLSQRVSRQEVNCIGLSWTWHTIVAGLWLLPFSACLTTLIVSDCCHSRFLSKLVIEALQFYTVGTLLDLGIAIVAQVLEVIFVSSSPSLLWTGILSLVACPCTLIIPGIVLV